MRRNSRQRIRSLRRRALTLIELLVAVGLVTVVIVSVSQVFRVTSEATAVTQANAQLVKRSRNINETLEREVGNLADKCFLAIVAPPPIRNTREVSNGPTYPLQRDAIAFGARGNAGEYQSATDQTAFGADLEPVSSSEALVYFGLGNSVSDTSFPFTITPPEFGQLFTHEWPFIHRTILLLSQSTGLPAGVDASPMDAHVNAAGNGIFDATDGLPGDYENGTTDIIHSGQDYRANLETVAQIIMDKDWATDLASNTPSITPLWSRSYASPTVSVNPLTSTWRNFYRRNGASMLFGLADFRVEWTDGRPIDPIGPDGRPRTGDENFNTRWFGIRPQNQTVTQNDIDLLEDDNLGTTAIPFGAAKRHQAVYNANLHLSSAERQRQLDAEDDLKDIYRNRIEWPRDNNAGTDFAMYRAIWRADTWEYRPKALRFTYRLYDDSQRIKNYSNVDLDRDGTLDPDLPLNATRQMVRMGREFTVVVPVP